jgi:hypothetical protein
VKASFSINTCNILDLNYLFPKAYGSKAWSSMRLNLEVVDALRSGAQWQEDRLLVAFS